MRHVGLDVHKQETTIWWIDDGTGEISRAQSVPTTEVTQHLLGLDGELRIVMETALHGKFLIRELISCGLQAWLLDARKVAAAMPSYKTAKTDRLDARALAQMSHHNAIANLTVWIPDLHTEQLRALTRTRENLVCQTTMLRNELRAQLGALGLDLPATDVLGPKAQQWLAKQLPQLPEYAQFCLQRVAQSLRAVHEQIKLLDREIIKLSRRDPGCQQLQQVTGCGPLTAVTVVGELGNVARFPNHRRSCSYAGLAPLVKQSGEHSYTGPIPRGGNPHLRRALILLAQHFAQSKRNTDTALKKRYYRLLHKHGPNTAKVDLARLLLKVIIAMLRSGQDYQPRLAA